MLGRIIAVPIDDVEMLETCVATHKKRVDHTTQQCKRVQEALAEIRETPDVLDIFSAKEIRIMNEIDRRISGLIMEIQRLKPLIVTDDYQLVGGKYESDFKVIEDALEKVWYCIEGMEAKIPEPEFNIYAWLDSPVFVTTYVVRRFIYQLGMRMRKK